MKSLKLIGPALGLALATSLALSASALAQDITVGVAGPMTGGESAFGRQMKNGAEQAVEDLNTAGGVLGKKLALQVGDDACDPKQARSVAEKFASAKVPFVAVMATHEGPELDRARQRRVPYEATVVGCNREVER